MANTVIAVNAVDLQNKLTQAGSQPISKIIIDPSIITLNQPLIIPQTLNAPGKHLIIEGNGCTITPAAGVTLTHLMKVDDNQGALPSLTNKITIENINFNGNSTNTICLELTSTIGSTIIGCTFRSASYGIRLQYAPHTRIISCAVTGMTVIGIDVNKYLGAAQTNLYGSAYTRIENVLVQNESTTYAALNIIAAGGCIVSQFTSNPKAPLYHIVFDSDGYNGADNIMMDNLIFGIAVRNLPQANQVGSAIKLSMFGGYAKISGVTCDIGQTLIEASNQNTNVNATMPRVYFSHHTRLAASTKFKAGGSCGNPDVIWEMFDIDQGDTIWQGTRWVDGIVPVHRYSEFYQSPRNNKEIVTNSMKVNNNVISA